MVGGREGWIDSCVLSEWREGWQDGGIDDCVLSGGWMDGCVEWIERVGRALTRARDVAEVS